MKAVLRRIRISPKKANLVAGMVRGKKVNEALALLKFMPKKGAKTIYKVIHSAASNAKNNFKQNINDLFITKLLVTKGPTYKRSLPISRGRTHPIMKRTSHITVEVGVMEKAEPKTKEPETKELKNKKADTKPVVKKSVAKKTEKKVEKKEKNNS